MRVIQLLPATASAFSTKSIQIDALHLSPEVVIVPLSVGSGRIEWPERSPEATLVHVYDASDLSTSLLARIREPWVSDAFFPARGWSLRSRPRPAAIVSPLPDSEDTFIPEAVHDEYIALEPVTTVSVFRVGSLARNRDEVQRIHAVRNRIERFRTDLEWVLFDSAPTASEMARLTLWFDPSTVRDGINGSTAEAAAGGRIVVAARTAINQTRLSNGASGFLVAPEDANEMAHVILNALFKPELALPRVEHAAAHRDRFRGSERVARLLDLYRRLG